MKNIKVLGLVLLLFAGIVGFAQTYDGFTLYCANNTSTVNLIDMSGTIVHSWNCDYDIANTVYLLENGNIMKTGRDPGAQLNGGAQGGYIEEYEWDGTLVWQYKFSGSTYLLHHDIEILPNGNVIAIAWDVKTGSEAFAQGSSNSDEMWPTQIIEVEKTGLYTGNIVWEWHAWDHLVQDYSSSKPNYGVVEDHPELININYTGDHPLPPGGGDWLHANGIDYNESLDQIVFSSHTLNELYVIDHSTTTAEAASHSGGNSGKGGDLLYRWGNPQAYDQGTSSDQNFYVVHNGQWIDNDLPGGGNFMAFNNGDGRPGGNESSIDEWTSPVDAFGDYTYTVGTAYAPSALTWTHTCEGYSNHLSSAQRLPNGNTLITEGTLGHFYEIDASQTNIWEYSIGMGECTRSLRYGCDYSGLDGLNLDCNCDVDGTAYIDDCDDCVEGNTGLIPCVLGIDNGTKKIGFSIYPNPSTGVFYINSYELDDIDFTVSVFDVTGKIVKQISNTKEINLLSLNNGIYYIEITVDNSVVISKKRISLIK